VRLTLVNLNTPRKNKQRENLTDFKIVILHMPPNRANKPYITSVLRSVYAKLENKNPL